MENHLDMFIQQLNDPNPETRKQGIVELGKADISACRQEVIRAFITLLGDPDIAVREAAEHTLIVIGGRDIVTALVPRLSDPSTTILNSAIAILSQTGDVAIDQILPLLESRDHDIRKFGCDILGNLQYADSIYELIELLNDPHVNVAIAAGEALGKIGDLEAVPYLIRALQHHDTWMKCIAAEALGKIGDQRAVDPFISMSVYEDPIVLYTVIKAMGNFQDKRVLPYILSILRSNPVFAPSASQAIEHLAHLQGESVYREVRSARVGKHFIRLLSHDNKEILRSAVNIVRHLQISEAVEPLETLLFQTVHTQTNENLRLEVATALGTILRDIPQLQELHGESIINTLLEKIQHEDTSVQIAAIDTLCALAPYVSSAPKAIPVLQELITTTTVEALQTSLHEGLSILETR